MMTKERAGENETHCRGDLGNEIEICLEPHQAGRKFMDSLIAAMLLKTQQKKLSNETLLRAVFLKGIVEWFLLFCLGSNVF